MDLTTRINPSDSLTLGATKPSKEARRLLKQLERERHAVTRRGLLSAVEELVAGIRKHEDEMATNDYRGR